MSCSQPTDAQSVSINCATSVRVVALQFPGAMARIQSSCVVSAHCCASVLRWSDRAQVSGSVVHL